jgi:hypothetical protein
MKEYDFRFPGLTADMQNARNAARVMELRAAILAAAGGFTEIPSGKCLELIPGEGIGYVVTLKSVAGARALQSVLRALAVKWNLPAPRVSEASKGPRGNYCFVIV